MKDIDRALKYLEEEIEILDAMEGEAQPEYLDSDRADLRRIEVLLTRMKNLGLQGTGEINSAISFIRKELIATKETIERIENLTGLDWASTSSCVPDILKSEFSERLSNFEKVIRLLEELKGIRKDYE